MKPLMAEPVSDGIGPLLIRLAEKPKVFLSFRHSEATDSLHAIENSDAKYDHREAGIATAI
jgi:hypothetical protein